MAKSDASMHAPLYIPVPKKSSQVEVDVSEDRTFPVVVFSHGLGGFRGSYSHLCASFVKMGCVVFAIEHRDGSACAAYHPEDPVSYIYPDIPETRDEQIRLDAFRMNQIYIKINEIHEVIDSIRNLNSSGTKNLNLVDISKKCKNILDSFEGRLDLNKMFAVGHSFGGASILSFIQLTDHPFRAAIVFDQWMQSVNLDAPTHIPVLSINSANFHWTDQLKQLLKHQLTLKTSKFILITDSSHADVTDYCINFPSLMKMVGARGVRHPVATKAIWIAECLKFLSDNCSHHVFDAYKMLPRATRSEVLIGKDAIDFLKDNHKENCYD